MFLGFTLQKRGFDVTVFEKSAQFSRFGGPIQLASNALSCLKAIDDVLFEKIMERFTFTGTRAVSNLLTSPLIYQIILLSFLDSVVLKMEFVTRGIVYLML